jgi:hypothetical protein
MSLSRNLLPGAAYSPGETAAAFHIATDPVKAKAKCMPESSVKDFFVKKRIRLQNGRFQSARGCNIGFIDAA